MIPDQLTRNDHHTTPTLHVPPFVQDHHFPWSQRHFILQTKQATGIGIKAPKLPSSSSVSFTPNYRTLAHSHSISYKEQDIVWKPFYVFHTSASYHYIPIRQLCAQLSLLQSSNQQLGLYLPFFQRPTFIDLAINLNCRTSFIRDCSRPVLCKISAPGLVISLYKDISKLLCSTIQFKNKSKLPNGYLWRP